MPILKNLQISFAAAEGDSTVDVEDSDDDEDEGPATDSDELATASRSAVESMISENSSCRKPAGSSNAQISPDVDSRFLRGTVR